MALSETPTTITGDGTGTAGTAKQVSTTSRKVASLLLIAKRSNTGTIYIGGSDITSTIGNIGLLAGDSIKVSAAHYLDLSDVYFIVSTTGEGVDFFAVKT